MNSQSSLNDFIKFTNSRKEVSLAIAKDDTELREFKENLEKHYFRQATEVSQLMFHVDSPAKLYFVVSGDLSKELYDFILQYPTGRVQIFDANKMKSNISVPVYKGVSIVLITTKDNLSKLQNSEFPILGNVGITYQS